MGSEQDECQAQASRRRLLRTAGGLAAVGALGVGSSKTAAANPGTQQWAFQTGDNVASPPTVVDGTVFVGSGDGNLYAVDAETGRQQWAFETGDGIFLSPTVAGRTVFVGSRDNSLYAVDAETGEQQWAFQTGDRVQSSPTVVDRTVFLGSRDNSLYAVDAETGRQQWAFQTGDRVQSSPTVVDGTVFVGSWDNNLYAVDAETGEQQWAHQTNDWIWSSPTVVDGTVFVGSGDENLYAVDAETGEQQWAFQTGDRVQSSPTVVDGTVFVGSWDNNLYAVDTETGEQDWAFRTGHNVASSPTVVDGTIFVGSWDNNLYAVDAETGEQQWAFRTGHNVASSPTVVDGTVFVGSVDNSLYAVEAGVDGSSEDSRVTLGTLGHHNAWAGLPPGTIDFEEPDAEPDADTAESNTEETDAEPDSGITTTLGSRSSIDRLPSEAFLVGGVGMGATIVALAGRYVKMRRASEQADPEPTQKSAPSATKDSESPQSVTDASAESNSSFDIDYRERAQRAYEAGKEAFEPPLKLERARNSFESALIAWQTALDEADDKETQAEIKNQIRQARAHQQRVESVAERLDRLKTTLEGGEWNLHKGIGPLLRNKITEPRISFQRARHAYADAIEIIGSADEPLLEPPVTVEIDRGEEGLPESFEDHPTLTEDTIESLADRGVTAPAELTVELVESLEGLSQDEEDALQPLCWWHADKEITFASVDEIKARRQRAIEGLDAL